MIRGLYSAASALDAASRHHEIVAQNLAHASMPGYRRLVVSFETFDQSLSRAFSGSGNILGTQVAAARAVFDPGDLQFTGNPLDLALRGDSFFVLEGPSGPVYTRNGVFQLGGQGELQNASGLPVSGSSGRITVPPGTTQITVREDGAVLADKTEIGRLKLAQFKETSDLVPVGTTLFEAPRGVRPADGTGTVHQYYREGSNVQVVDELVQMIAGMRHYEASQRALRAMSDAVEQDTRPQAG